MDHTETFGAGGTARERALLSWTHAYEDVEFDVRLDEERAGLGADERRGLLHDPFSSPSPTPSTPPRVPAAVHVYAHTRSSSSSSALDALPVLVPSPAVAPAIPAATPAKMASTSTSGMPVGDAPAASASAAAKLMPAASGSPRVQMQRGDDPYDYHVYNAYTDNSIATPPTAAGAQQYQQSPPTAFSSLSSSATLANTSPAVLPPSSSTTPPPTPPKPTYYSLASSVSAPAVVSGPGSGSPAVLRTQSPPRTGSFKAFASSPLAGAGGPSPSPSVSSAPFLVLTSGGADGSSPGGQRGSTLIDGPRPSSSQGPSSTTAGQRHPNIVPAGGPPTPRLSNSSSSASSIPALGSGSLSASTSLTAASPPLTNATSSSTFVSPFARPGTRPMAGLAFAGVPVGNGHQHGQLQGSTSGSVVSNRGSMILYRLSASEDGMLGGDGGARNANNGGPPGGPPPPVYGATMRHSAFYSETDSLTLDDSKYPPFPNGSNGTSASASRLPTPRGSVLGLSAGPPGSPGSPGGPPIGTSPLTLGMRSSANELASLGRAHGGLVAYVYDPDDDEEEDDDEYEDDYYGGDKKAREEKRMEDWVHDPTEVNALYAGVGKLKKAPPAPARSTGKPTVPGGAPPPGAPLRPGHPQQQRAPYRPPPSAAVSLRGLVNVTTLVALILALLCLFIVLPVAKAFTDNGVELKILANTRINATGQAERRELGVGGKERREWRFDFGQER
ncbi:hypothetical protein BJ912DRAFT_101257 [Pholiota molesta]|nr:hypothetical protein BJ912DRAFT_101257 [Pholiota molesta]